RVISASHPVLGKPVKIRRCPATVWGDDGLSCHRLRAGRRARGRTPSQETGRVTNCLPSAGRVASGAILLKPDPSIREGSGFFFFVARPLLRARRQPLSSEGVHAVI